MTVVGAAVALGVLAGCGQKAEPAGDAAGSTTTPSTSSTTSSSAPGKPAPSTPTPSEPPSNVVEPTPPASAKPQHPSNGEPPVTIGPDGPVVPAGVTEVPAAQIDATALPDYYKYGGRVWAFDNGLSLQMFAMASSGCSAAEAVLVDQAADSIKVILRPMDQPQGGRPDDDKMCTAVLTPRAVVVTLDTPLQDRTIYLSASR